LWVCFMPGPNILQVVFVCGSLYLSRLLEISTRVCTYIFEIKFVQI
jgi:hypothetical protein